MTLIDRTDWSTPAAELLVITPEEAHWVLNERNPEHEEVDIYDITRLVDRLQDGQWVVNGETITFRADGTLRNGRHRLWACVVSGVPLRTWVIFGTE
jgi:hypothetical protein